MKINDDISVSHGNHYIFNLNFTYDFYLRGYLKFKVYYNISPATLQELKSNIRRQRRSIKRDTFAKVYYDRSKSTWDKGASIEHTINDKRRSGCKFVNQYFKAHITLLVTELE